MSTMAGVVCSASDEAEKTSQCVKFSMAVSSLSDPRVPAQGVRALMDGFC